MGAEKTKKVQDNESKADKFVRLGEYRVNKVIDAIGRLENLFNRTNYEYTQEQVEVMFSIMDKVSTEKELLSCIKQAKGSAESLFDYRIINDSKRLGVEISLKSEIIDVDGFPFKAFVGDNVNILIDERIQSHSSEESQ